MLCADGGREASAGTNDAKVTAAVVVCSAKTGTGLVSPKRSTSPARKPSSATVYAPGASPPIVTVVPGAASTVLFVGPRTEMRTKSSVVVAPEDAIMRSATPPLPVVSAVGCSHPRAIVTLSVSAMPSLIDSSLAGNGDDDPPCPPTPTPTSTLFPYQHRDH